MTPASEQLLGFWRRMPESAPFIHPDDAAVLVRHAIDPAAHGIRSELFPQPWVGPIATARGFVLQLNPGYSEAETKIEKDSAEFRQALRDNLSGHTPNLFLDDRFAAHPGRRWVESHLRGVASLDRLRTDIAQIELFPYHSEKFDFPARLQRLLLDLPSTRAIRAFVHGHILPAAERGECGVVVQRRAKDWGLEARKDSPQVIVYRGGMCRGGWITSNTNGGAMLKRVLADG